MNEYIKKDDAIRAVKKVSENYTGKGKREYHPHIDFIIDAISHDVPPADVVERKRGIWQRKNYHTDYCNICGFEEVEWRTIEYNFCPNCGADMRGADDE